jgi:hypothetical protein
MTDNTLHVKQGGGFYLTPHQRAHLATRLMLKGPANATPEEIAAHRRSIDGFLNGLPGDILFALDSLRLLADQGNRVAEYLLDRETERLGLTRPKHFGL